jgi:2-oxo-4-hydroxy-4-carboxy--5-ureidoimidazoline (OHCU) decarboxylase
VRDLPRQLTESELAELFEGRTRLVERLAARRDPLGSAAEVIGELSEEEKLEALDAHPPIGAKTLSARSGYEQGSRGDDDAETLAELQRLNRQYEERFGFRFVVFVNRRPKREIAPILRARLQRSRAQELDTALHELVAIAEDRWRRS